MNGLNDGAREASSARMPAWIPRVILLTALVAVATILALLLLRQLYGLIWILVIAMFLSFAIEPAVNWFTKHGWKRFWATFAIMIVLLVFCALLALEFIPLFVNQVGNLVSFAADVVAKINPYLERWFGTGISLDQIKGVLPQIAGWGFTALGGIVGIAKSIFGIIGQVLAIAFFTFFAVLDGPKLRRFICSFMNRDRQERVLWTWNTALDKTGSYFYSRLLQAAIAGGAGLIVMLILRMPFAFPLALWIGLVSQFIPAVGTYIAALLPLLIAVFVGWTDFLVLGAWFLVYQLVENYLISPKITAKTMELHPAVALGSAFAGGALFGAIGAFLALPAAAIIQAGLTTYATRYEVMETELTREEPKDPEETKVSAGELLG